MVRRKKKPHPYAVRTGRAGGKKRMKALTPEQRSELARRAARARWDRRLGDDVE